MPAYLPDQLDNEHCAWGAVCLELLALTGYTGSINDPKFREAIAAAQRWGEELAALRRKQQDSTVEGALRDAREKFPHLARRGDKGWERTDARA